MLDRDLEELTTIHLYGSCDRCDNAYFKPEGYGSFIDMEKGFCSESCAVAYDKEIEEDDD